MAEIEKGYNLLQVAEFLGLKVRTVRLWAQSGKIKTACTMVCLCIMLFFLGRCPLWLNSLCIALIVVTTVYSGFEYFRNNYRVFSE